MSPSPGMAKRQKSAKNVIITLRRMRCFLYAIFDDFGLRFGSQNRFNKCIPFDCSRHMSSRCHQDAPRAAQDAPRAPQERPKAAQERPETPQECPKSALRAPKRAPRAPQETPITENMQNHDKTNADACKNPSRLSDDMCQLCCQLNSRADTCLQTCPMT